MAFPDSSVSKESACNAGDPGSIPGSGRSSGEGIGYSLSILGLPKRLPSMRETQVRSLGWEVPLEKEMVTYSSILAWRIPWTKKPGGLQSTGSQRVRHDWATSLPLSLVAQLVRNLPAMQKTGARSLGWEDPLEKGKATHSGILAWRIPWTV